MTSIRQFSDEELTSFLDGEADPELQQAIEAALSEDDNLVQRLEDLSIETDTIKSAFSGLLADAPNPPMLMSEHETSSFGSTGQFNYFRAASIACLVFAAGILLGRIISLPDQATWHEYAAKYHALYVTDTLAAVPTDPKGLDTALTRARSALKHKLSKQALTDVAGLDLKRSQVLGFEGRPLIRLAYLSQKGAPVALCIIGNPAATKSPPHVTSMEGLAAASWSKGGYDFLLIGGKDATLIRDAALKLQKQL
ncbi:MAG: hypothetical protein CBC34_020935 [Hyphomicrobiaceae bacterium TMED74]|nr:hypothetical protein [Filomicrobium sp.]RPG35907.1 MAG: hypothetical protein CBC34_020935 [Hyphomicrobiaceae bacterium TMED74]